MSLFFETLTELPAGTPIIVGGDKVLRVPAELAARFREGDSVAAVEATAEILLIPAEERRIASDAVTQASAAFRAMAEVSDAQIAAFYQGFAQNLRDEPTWEKIVAANQADIAAATRRGRSTTRLVASEKLRQGMIEGLLGWVTATSRRGQVLETVQHAGWRAELVGAELGVVGFVFEGRPNVLADATGVLRGGNTVVFRIGRDALGTARAMMQLALEPARKQAGLPEGACVLIDSSEHAAGWALFMDSRLGLAVARGSGPAVATLGSLARQAGVAVSLHGTGGAWICLGESARESQVVEAIFDSLDRKVCNTVNTICVPEARAAELIPAVLAGLGRAGARRQQAFKLHVESASKKYFPQALFSEQVQVRRAAGEVSEAQAELIEVSELGREWEWEDTPEVSVVVVKDLAHASALFNEYSPQFVASLLSEKAEEHEWFYRTVNAPFVGDAFTRWVDGQFALKRPELGLSNWEHGRLFGRGGILSGDSVFTVRTRNRSTPA